MGRNGQQQILVRPRKKIWALCAGDSSNTHIYIFIYSRKNRKHNDQNVFLCLCTYHLKHMQIAEQIGNMHISWLCLKQLEICLHKTCSFGDPKIDSFLRSRSEGRWKNRANGCRSNEDLEFTLHIWGLLNWCQLESLLKIWEPASSQFSIFTQKRTSKDFPLTEDRERFLLQLRHRT